MVENLSALATDEFCWPSRGRADKGVEITAVKRLVLLRMGNGRGSISQGGSVLSQRTERLWRDAKSDYRVLQTPFPLLGK